MFSKIIVSVLAVFLSLSPAHAAYLGGYNTPANKILAGPTVGGNSTATFRSLVAADIPALAYAPSALITGHFFVGVGGVATDQTAAQATAALNLFSNVLQGLVPASGGGAVNFLRADGAWTVPPGGASPLTTKGDIWGYDVADARIPACLDGESLQYDSTQALGVKCVTAGGGGGAGATSSISLDTWAAQGATNTIIPQFAASIVTGTDLTLTFNDATNGAVITVNTTGTYVVTFNGDPQANTQSTFFIVQNPTFPATTLAAGGTRLGVYVGLPAAGAQAASTVWVGALTAGDVIIPTSNTSPPATPQYMHFGIAKIGNGGTVPTQQKFLAGSGTYTTPVSPSPIYIKVTMIGAGGGGGPDQTGVPVVGTAGGDSTFGLDIAGGGLPGSATNVFPGDGGVCTLSSITGISVQGGQGTIGAHAQALLQSGGGGGAGAFGQGGRGGPGGGNGANAHANSGAGGGGAGTGAGGGGVLSSGGGGGSGCYISGIITAPAATYTYDVGAAGTGGSGGGGGATNGGNGGSGQILVEEFYQ